MEYKEYKLMVIIRDFNVIIAQKITILLSLPITIGKKKSK